MEKEAKVAFDAVSEKWLILVGFLVARFKRDEKTELEGAVDLVVSVTPRSIVEKRLSLGRLLASATVVLKSFRDRADRRAAARITFASARRSTIYFGSDTNRSLILRQYIAASSVDTANVSLFLVES